MNYLDALKSKKTPVKEYNTVIQTFDSNSQKEVTHDEMYIKNVEDSCIIHVLPELQHMCEEFVETTLEMDCPLLMQASHKTS